MIFFSSQDKWNSSFYIVKMGYYWKYFLIRGTEIGCKDIKHLAISKLFSFFYCPANSFIKCNFFLLAFDRINLLVFQNLILFLLYTSSHRYITFVIRLPSFVIPSFFFRFNIFYHTLLIIHSQLLKYPFYTNLPRFL